MFIICIRDYFGYKGDITVTTNSDLSIEGYKYLESKGIDVVKLDLDPFVCDPDSSTDRLPTSIECQDGSFDLILSSHVIEHLYHPMRMLEECFRLLRKDGRIVVTTDNGKVTLTGPDQKRPT